MEGRGLVDHPAERLPQISLSRVLVLGVLTAGLYIFYWSCYTWKQLQPYTRDQHYPVWHALSLLVPIYGLFRLHKHLSVINDQAIRAGGSSLSPFAGVTLVVLSNALAWASLGISDVTSSVVVTTIVTALIVVALYFAQDGLNQADRTADAAYSLGRGVHWAEGVLIILGMLTWIGAFFPA